MPKECVPKRVRPTSMVHDHDPHQLVTKGTLISHRDPQVRITHLARSVDTLTPQVSSQVLPTPCCVQLDSSIGVPKSLYLVCRVTRVSAACLHCLANGPRRLFELCLAKETPKCAPCLRAKAFFPTIMLVQWKCSDATLGEGLTKRLSSIGERN
jgi:hypothetical protein